MADNTDILLDGTSPDTVTENSSAPEIATVQEAAVVDLPTPTPAAVETRGELDRSSSDGSPETHRDQVSPAEGKPHPQLLPESVALESDPLSKPESFLKSWGKALLARGKAHAALIIAALGLLATSISVYVAMQQSESSKDQVTAQFIEDFNTHLKELSDRDVQSLTKKKLAAVTLARYGERALPALKSHLSIDDQNIRQGSAVVIAQMLEDSSLHETVLSKLKEYSKENNALLRIGVLECYATINTGLKPDEFDDARTVITQYVNPAANYVNKSDEQRVLVWAVKWFAYWPSKTSKDFLLAVANNTTCSDQTRVGAINWIASVTNDAKDLTPEEHKIVKKEVVNTLQNLLPQASGRIRPNIIDAIKHLQNQ